MDEQSFNLIAFLAAQGDDDDAPEQDPDAALFEPEPEPDGLGSRDGDPLFY